MTVSPTAKQAEHPPLEAVRIVRLLRPPSPRARWRWVAVTRRWVAVEWRWGGGQGQET